MKNINLKASFCLIIIFCTLFVMFSACTETGVNQTVEPSANAYADPTEKATLTPITLAPFTLPPPVVPITPCPTPPEEKTHDYEMLKAFFDNPSKVEGKTNGQLLFKDYDPDNPYTWHVHTEAEHKAYVEYCESIGEYQLSDYDEFILWGYSGDSHRNYNGSVTEIKTRFQEAEEMLNFGGTLCFDGFESLKSIQLFNISADELIVTNCDKLDHVYLAYWLEPQQYRPCFNKVYIEGKFFECYSGPCAKEFRLINSFTGTNRDFDITVFANGDGLVCVDQEVDTNYDHVLVWAKANEGSHFVGWYDEEGHLVSEDEKFMLTEWDQYEPFNDTATYTARFEKD